MCPSQEQNLEKVPLEEVHLEEAPSQEQNLEEVPLEEVPLEEAPSYAASALDLDLDLVHVPASTSDEGWRQYCYWSWDKLEPILLLEQVMKTKACCTYRSTDARVNDDTLKRISEKD